MIAVTADPRRLVRSADLIDLLAAYAAGGTWSWHPFALVHDEVDTRFICPRCCRVNYNGGTALVVDEWRWWCHSCRFTGTRPWIERIVLEDADRLGALYEAQP